MFEEIIEYILLWLFFSFIIGIVGSNRKIGYWNTFFISLLLSPLLGLIVALCSKKENKIYYQDNIQKEKSCQSHAIPQKTSTSLQSISLSSITEGLEKLKKLKDENVITNEEFLILKNKAINSYKEDLNETSISNIKMDDYNYQKNKLRSLYKLINEQKNNLFPSTETKQKITDLTESILISKDIALSILSDYRNTFSSDMIEDLKSLTSSYSGIKEYLQRFIELGIISAEYPHNRIDK